MKDRLIDGVCDVVHYLYHTPSALPVLEKTTLILDFRWRPGSILPGQLLPYSQLRNPITRGL